MQFRTCIHKLYPKHLIMPSKYNPDRRKMNFPVLQKSIEENGVIIPILVTSDFFIVDGEHRHRYCKSEGIDCIEYIDYTEKDIPFLIHVLGTTAKPYRQGHSAQLYINHREVFADCSDKKIRDYDMIYALFGEDFFRFVAFGLRTVTTDLAKVFRILRCANAVHWVWNSVNTGKNKRKTPPELIQFYGTIFVIVNELQTYVRTPEKLEEVLCGHWAESFREFARDCSSGRINVKNYHITTKHENGEWNWLPFRPFHTLGVLSCDGVEEQLSREKNCQVA